MYFSKYLFIFYILKTFFQEKVFHTFWQPFILSHSSVSALMFLTSCPQHPYIAEVQENILQLVLRKWSSCVILIASLRY